LAGTRSEEDDVLAGADRLYSDQGGLILGRIAIIAIETQSRNDGFGAGFPIV